MFSPIKVVDIELSQSIPSFENLNSHNSIWGLIRWHRDPIGYIKLSVKKGICTSQDIIEKIVSTYCPTLIQKALSDWILDPNRDQDFNFKTHFNRNSGLGALRYQPLVTVAICTRNRTEYLCDCLLALKKLTYSNLEILVIDNAPDNDRTQTMVHGFTDVCYVCEPLPGLNHARNKAIQTARGDIIAFTDDDTIVDAHWINAIVTAFDQNPWVDCVTGLVVPYELEVEPQLMFEHYDGFGRGYQQKWGYMGTPVRRNVAIPYGGAGKFGTGANMAFRKGLFSKIGFFDPALDVGTVTLGGGDLDIFFRVIKEGSTLLYEPKAIVRHRHRQTIQQLEQQAFSWGVAPAACLVKNILTYKDEQFASILMWFRLLVSRNLLRLIGSILFPNRYVRSLIFKEIKGLFIGLFRYQKSKINLVKLKNSQS